MTTLKKESSSQTLAPQKAVSELATWRQHRARQIQELRLRNSALMEADPTMNPREREGLAVDDRLWDRQAPDAGQPQNPPSVAVASSSDVVDDEGEADEFTVPRPGGHLRRIGIGRSWITRIALLGAPLVLIGGLTFSCGVSAGSARLVTPGAISAGEAAAYHLTTYPSEQAAAFGSTYVTLCLTHPNPSDDTAIADRLTGLARMTSSGVTSGCGWDGTGKAQKPLAVTWTGTTGPSPGVYGSGTAAQMGYVATMADGRTLEVAVPIWASSSTGTVNFRIVGDLSLLPAQIPTSAPTPNQPAVVDPALAQSLTGSVLLPFLQAWSASDPIQLNLILAGGASASAQQGLEGQLTSPQIDTAQIVVNSGNPEGYREGDRVTAQVTVDWTTAGGGGVQTAAYSIELRRVAGRWLVTDITGGPPDDQGGAAANTTFSSPYATSLPTTSG